MKTGILVLALLLAGGSQPAHAAVRAAGVSVTVSVFNDARVPKDELNRARLRAEAVMLRAGVLVDWLDCGTPENRPSDTGCSNLSFPKHLSMRLVSGRLNPGEGGLRSDVFGHSFQNEDGEGNYAVVYCDALLGSSSAKSVGSGDLLGLVIAHELGHLLLGLNSHSREGLMSSVWRGRELRQAQLGAFFFSDAEAGRMASRLVAASTITRRDQETRSGAHDGR